MGFRLVEESPAIKDRLISILRMKREACGHFSKKGPSSADLKKNRNCLEIGEDDLQSRIIFLQKDFIFGFYMLHNRSQKSGIILDMPFRD